MSTTKEPSILARLALPIYIPSMLIMMGTGAVMLVIPLLAIELTKNYGAASLAFAMMSVGNLIADVPAGMVVSRIGVRKSTALGIFMLFITTFLAGFITSTLFLGIVGLFMGAGRGFILLARVTYIAETTSDARGRAMSAVGGAMRIGALLGPTMGGFMVKYLGYQVTMVASSFVIASAFVFLPFIKSNVVGSVPSSNHNPLNRVGAILKENRSIFMTAGVAVMGLQLLRSARPLIVTLWGTDIGLDAAEIGLITGIPMALEMTMFYPVGTIMDRMGRKWAAVPCIVLLSLGILLIPLSHAFISFMVIALVAAFGNGLGSGIVLTLGADFSPEDQRADFLGVWRLIGDAGHTSSPFLVGLITQLFALTSAIFAIGGIGVAAAVIMLFLVKESRDVAIKPIT